MFRIIQRFMPKTNVAHGSEQPEQRPEATATPQDTLGATVDVLSGAAAASGQPLTLVLPGQSTHAAASPQDVGMPPAPRPVLTAQTLAAWAQAPSISELESSDRRAVARCILEAARPMPGSFPVDALVICGDLKLENFNALTTLPKGLTIGGSLLLNDMPGLTALPGHLTVDGAIEVKGCAALAAIEDDIVADKVVLFDCAALTDVSATLKTSQFEVTGATSLVTLPATLRLEKLKLIGCTALEVLPDGSSLRELIVIGCTSLAYLPNHLMLQVLDATGCTALRALPGDLDGETICLKGCAGLQALPSDFFVYRLDLTDCTGITRIDEPVATDVLNCSGCINLESLPASMHITELNATGCTALRALPEVLEVDCLKIVGCTGLSALPEKMLIRKFCDMRGCVGVRRLPRQMDVQGHFNTGDCSALTFAAAKATVSSSPNMMKALLLAQEDLGGANFGNLIFSPEIDFFVGRVPFAERLGLLRAAQQMYSPRMDAEDFRDIVASLVYVRPEDSAAFIDMASNIFAMFPQRLAEAAQLIRTLGELGTRDRRANFIEQLREEEGWLLDATPEYREIETALSDVVAWHKQLADTRTTYITQAQADDASCPIEHTTFAEMECPVAVYTGHVLHVFELEALLTWLRTSLASRAGAIVGTNPANNLPLPLTKVLRAEIAR